MKKFLIVLTFVSTIFSCEAVWNNGPTQLLKDIFKIMNVSGVEKLETAVQQSNFRWIRPKGLELWDRQYSLLDDTQRLALTKIVSRSDLAKEKLPCKKHYDAIVILGATTTRVKSRIEFFSRIHKLGTSCDKVYLLGSTRDLKIGTEADKEMAQALEEKGAEATEMAMMQELWHQSTLSQPSNSIIIAIQSGQREDGTRANTEDTLRDMVKDFGDAKGKNFLFISNNPYIPYQDAVAKKVLSSSGANIETVGQAMPDNTTIENVLDTVARCLTNIQGLNGLSKANQ